MNLDKYLIPAMESTSSNNMKEKINFFDKEWNVSVKFDKKVKEVMDKGKGQIGGSGDAIMMTILKVVHNGASISKSAEKKFCELCEKYNDDPEYTKMLKGSIKTYKDVKGLRLTSIYVTFHPWNSKNILVVLQGEYDIDPEHGWCMPIKNGQWTGELGQFSDYY